MTAMLATARSRAVLLLSRRARTSVNRSYASSVSHRKGSPNPAQSKNDPNLSKANELPVQTYNIDQLLPESQETERFSLMQAPNRESIWSRSQNPRQGAMSGPRFEQTTLKLQPAPEAAIEFIHKQPVRWVHERVVQCDGGGGPLGHPRIFINVDKPEICTCNYCGLPFANEHHRAHLESLPSTSYPLKAQEDIAEIPETQRITAEALGHRQICVSRTVDCVLYSP